MTTTTTTPGAAQAPEGTPAAAPHMWGYAVNRSSDGNLVRSRVGMTWQKARDAVRDWLDVKHTLACEAGKHRHVRDIEDALEELDRLTPDEHASIDVGASISIDLFPDYR